MKYNNKLILILFIIVANTIIGTSCNNKNFSNVFNKNKASINKKCQLNKIKLNKINHANNDSEDCQDFSIDSIEGQLISSAKSIEKSLAVLAATQEIDNIPVLNTAPLITPEGGMGSTADIDWTGPIEPLLQKIATITNYNLKILGSPSSIPIIVSITQNKAIIADILKNACLQAAKRANIVVFPANKIIELRYRFGAYKAPSSSNNNEHDNS